MKDVFRRLGSDFLSTIIFLIIYFATDNVILATAVAIIGAVGQVIWSRIKGQTLGYMTWASLGLVIVLGGATLLTHDPRFVMAKPSIIYTAIAVVMLKRGWMLRYLPAVARGHGGDLMIGWGYAWSGLMALTAVLNLVVAVAFTREWPAFMAIWPLASKLGLFGVQYMHIHRVVRGRIIAETQTQAAQAQAA